MTPVSTFYLPGGREQRVALCVGLEGHAPFLILTFDALGQITHIVAESADGSLSTRLKLVPDEGPAC